MHNVFKDRLEATQTTFGLWSRLDESMPDILMTSSAKR